MNDDDGFSHNSNDFFLFVLDFYWKNRQISRYLRKQQDKVNLKVELTNKL